MKCKVARFLFLISFLTFFSVACKQEVKKAPSSVAVQDTTPLGLQIAEVSRKIGENPNNADLFHERAKLHMQRMDVANAMMDMQKVLSIDTTKADYFLTLADVHLGASKPGKSKAALEKCLSLDPKNKLAYEKLAELFFLVRQYKDALKNLDEVLKLDITNPKAYFMKGMCYRDLGDTTKALSSFQTAIEQKPDYYEPYLQEAMIYHARNNKLALQYYDGALRVNPKSIDALYGRGLWHQENERNYDLAIQDYTSAVQVSPKAARAHFALGYIHYQYLKVYDQAVKHYNDAIQADSTWPEAYYNRGLSYEAMGNIAAANQDYSKAMMLRPNYSNAQQAAARVNKPVK
ncbi:MAG: tetratricopeptide repeat protein [Bacteroidia bacterium]